MLRPDTLLALVLRAIGGLMLLAMFAAVLPGAWMVEVHAWLGLGDMPRGVLVEYLTRSLSLLYALHGGVLLVAASDVRRFAPLIDYIAVGHAAFGMAVMGIDLCAGMPWYWTVVEGPPIVVAGAMLYGLNRAVRGRMRSTEAA